MFMFPLVIAAFVAFAGYQAGKASRNKNAVIAGALPPPPRGMVWRNDHYERAPAIAPVKKVSYVALLTDILTRADTPSQALLNAAWSEARAAGDFQAVETIEQLFAQTYLGAPPMTPMVAGALQEQPPEAEQAPDLAEYESANPDRPAPPIPGVEAADWDKFISALRTKDPQWQTEHHLGAFEHNRNRLRQLAIPEAELATEDAQYKALCADMEDYTLKCEKLITDYAGDVVDVGGVQHPVTLSGILGLLKAGGTKGAEGWLRNPKDRKTFPRTTDTFLRTNGCF